MRQFGTITKMSQSPGKDRRQLLQALDSIRGILRTPEGNFPQAPELAALLDETIADIEFLVDQTWRLGSQVEHGRHNAWREGFDTNERSRSAVAMAPAEWLRLREELNPYLSPDPDPATDPELRELVKNATGGPRTSDAFGVIRFKDGSTLCVSIEYDVDWKSEADLAFVTKVTPYVVSQLMRERDSAEARCDRYAKLVRSLGGDPADQAKFQ